MVVTSGGAQGGGERRSGRGRSGLHLSSSATPKVRAASAAACTQFRSEIAVGGLWSAWQNWVDRCVAGQRHRYTTKAM